jgi:hypothetical protein
VTVETPGDGFVDDATGMVMHAPTIVAAPKTVWPWPEHAVIVHPLKESQCDW